MDIFFVISGYLIGGGLVRSLKENFSLSSFYYRRIRRIMPAYFCLIAVVLAFGCVVLACDDFLRTLGRTVAGQAPSSSPTLFSRTAGNYFSPAAEKTRC